MNIKKAISVVLTCVMLATIALTGCSGSSSNSTPSDNPSVDSKTTELPASNQPTESTDPAPEPEPEPEPANLTLFTAFGTANYEEEWYYNNPLAEKITEMSLVNINYDFPTITQGDAHDKLNLLLAGQTYPDIIWMGNDAILSRIIEESIALPLDDLIDQHGPAIKENYGHVLDKIRWQDGKIYYLPTGFGEVNPDALPGASGYTFNFRNDLYSQLGSPKLQTLDDVYNLLVSFKENFPNNSDGSPAYPLGGFVQGWQNMLDTLINSAGGYGSRYYIDDSGNLQYWTRAPWSKEIITFYNKVYREGLMDPDSFIMDRATWQKEKMGAEKVYSYFGNGSFGRVAEALFAEKGLEDAIMESYPISVSGGGTPRIVEEATIGGKQLIITDKCADPVAAIRWINTLCELNFEICNGIEGGIWDFVNGKPTLHQHVLDQYLAGPVTDQTWAPDTGFGMYKFAAKTVGGSEYGTNMILKDDPYVLGNQRVINRQERFKGYNYDTFPFSNLLRGASEELMQIHTIIDERMQNEIYQSVFANSEEACLSEFDKYVNEIERLGLAQLEVQWNANYQEAIKK